MIKQFLELVLNVSDLICDYSERICKLDCNEVKSCPDHGILEGYIQYDHERGSTDAYAWMLETIRSADHLFFLILYKSKQSTPWDESGLCEPEPDLWSAALLINVLLVINQTVEL